MRIVSATGMTTSVFEGAFDRERVAKSFLNVDLCIVPFRQRPNWVDLSIFTVTSKWFFSADTQLSYNAPRDWPYQVLSACLDLKCNNFVNLAIVVRLRHVRCATPE